MEKVSLKNIKIILLSITILVVVVLILKLQIASTASKTNPNQQTEQTSQTNEQTQSSTSNDENVVSDTKEEIEKDTEIIPRKSKKTKTETKKEKTKSEKEEEEYFFPTEETDYNYTKKEKTKSEKEDEEISSNNTETESKKETANTIIEQTPPKQKTPQETFDFALLEMRKGRLNSAIYEFNNAIDISKDPNMTLKARRYLAECYERKGINSEAFDIYEYIYLETGKKSDLIEMSRAAQKTNRAFTAYNYVQEYIEQHPEDQESLSQYLKY